MNPNWKDSTKFGLIGIAIGSVLVLPYFIWHSFWFLGIGLIVVVFSFLYLVYSIFKDNDGCAFSGIGFIFALILSILCVFWHEERYISPSGSKQHLYKDCRSLRNSHDIKLITEAEGFFHLTFSDCKICKEREQEIRKRKEHERIEEERRELREYLQNLIDRLNAGEDPEKIESKLTEDWSRDDDDEDDFVPGVPTRYQ